jgi:hypothetical protein
LQVGLAGLLGGNALSIQLAQQMRSEGWCKPELRFVFGALGGASRIGAAFFARATAFVEPLASVFITEHVRGWFDAHACLTASAAPRSVHKRELWGMVVNCRQAQLKVRDASR